MIQSQEEIYPLIAAQPPNQADAITQEDAGTHEVAEEGDEVVEDLGVAIIVLLTQPIAALKNGQI